MKSAILQTTNLDYFAAQQLRRSSTKSECLRAINLVVKGYATRYSNATGIFSHDHPLTELFFAYANVENTKKLRVKINYESYLDPTKSLDETVEIIGAAGNG